MTTKEQERKALEQIKKIVANLGENSYIATAFEGCFEIAAENIENDFACSMKQRKEAAEFAEDQLRAKVAEKDERIKQLEDQIRFMTTAAEKKEDCILAQGKSLEEMVSKIANLKEACTKHWNSLQEAETKLDQKEDEIVRLKAKLYDLMMAGK